MGVFYEWDIEKVDENEDIVDHDFQDKLAGFGALPTINGGQYRLVLVRNIGDEDEGVTDREWAYTVWSNGSWVLPDRFDGGAKVPKRFHAELLRADLRRTE